LREDIGRIHSENRHTEDWILHHDKAPAHAALCVTKFSTETIMRWSSTPYSPYLDSSGIFLIPKYENPVNGAKI
jgi:hypothetical protein